MALAALRMELRRFITTPGATPLRISKSGLRARTRDTAITFSREQICSHGGLELVRHNLEQIDLRARVRKAMAGHGPEGDYGFVRMLLVVAGLCDLIPFSCTSSSGCGE